MISILGVYAGASMTGVMSVSNGSAFSTSMVVCCQISEEPVVERERDGERVDRGDTGNVPKQGTQDPSSSTMQLLQTVLSQL